MAKRVTTNEFPEKFFGKNNLVHHNNFSFLIPEQKIVAK